MKPMSRYAPSPFRPDRSSPGSLDGHAPRFPAAVMRPGALALVVGAVSLVLAGCHHATRASDDADAQPPAQVQGAVVARHLEPKRIQAQAIIVADPRHVSHVASTEAQSIMAVSVRVGDTVRRGQLLVQLAEDPQAKAAYQQSVIELASARSTMLREEALVRGGVEPRVNADQAQTQYQLAAAQERAAKAALSQMEANTHLCAPMSGVVVRVSATVGQVTTPGADLVTIADPRFLMARLQIEPQDLARVQTGQDVVLHAPGSRGSFEARITRVAATLDPKTQLGEADAALPSSPAFLGIGRFLVADITVGQEDSLVVPSSALVHRDDGDKVYRVSGGKAMAVSVRPRGRYGDLVALTGNLAPGQEVVTTGSYELSDGAPITVTAASPSGR